MRPTPIFTLSFRTDGAVFDEYMSDEIVRILKATADRIAYTGIIEGSIADVHGHTIGLYKWEG
jgi:hypothetical protein